MNFAKSKYGMLLLSIILNLFFYKPVLAGSLDWLEPLPIDGYRYDYYFSADVEWRGNYFTLDRGRVLRDHANYWESQLISNTNQEDDLYLYGNGHLRAEKNWHGFSIGYVSGIYSAGSGTGNLDDLYRHFKNGTGTPGELYNVGYRYYTIQYQGLSLGYTWANQNENLILGVRGQWLVSRNYCEESYKGLVRFTDPDQLEGFLYNEAWSIGKKTDIGSGYSFDLMGRLNVTDQFSIFSVWRDIGVMTWKASQYRGRTLNYQFQINPDGSVDMPYIIESKESKDHAIRLDDCIVVGASYQFSHHALTLGLSYQNEHINWGIGEKIRINDEVVVILGYDDREGSLITGWQTRNLAMYINCNHINPNKATMLGIGFSWMI